MYNKFIWIGAVVIIVIGVAGYFGYMNYFSSPENIAAQEQNAGDVVQAQDTVVGTGPEATPNSIVSVLYIGKLSDGTVFDSSEAHGNEPLTFQLGAPGLIAGFQIGVNGMREGGERVIAVPPSFGYGNEEIRERDAKDKPEAKPTGKVIIPANSTIVFEIKLLKVNPAPVAVESE